jgi:CheY-like chemotaxis protein
MPSAILLSLSHESDKLVILERLKRDPATRHIPVHIVSSLPASEPVQQDEEREQSLALGAISYLAEPLTRERLQYEFQRIQGYLGRGKRNLLVVEDNQTQRDSIVELIGSADVQIAPVATGADALAAMKAKAFDCVVLDLSLPDMDGFEVLDAMTKDDDLRDVPVVVYTAKDLTRQEITKLKRIGKTVVVKDARSPERLLNETSLLLHRAQASMPEQQRRIMDAMQAEDSGLAGRSVLIVDDDLRNIFALSSVLERHDMKVSFAENGRDGIEVLEKDPSIEIVLMDIMMPEMDGYDTMRAIRQIPRFKSLPIITLTAKAMKGDRDKCIAAGASDYITKPVDVAQLLSLMRVWLH